MNPESSRLEAEECVKIKEQMPAIYAQKLAEQGYAAFAFDFRFYGESGGDLRNFESPTAKITDIKNAVSFLKTVEALTSPPFEKGGF